MDVWLPQMFCRVFTWQKPWFCVPHSPEAYRYLEKIFLFLVKLILLVKSSLCFTFISVRMIFFLIISDLVD